MGTLELSYVFRDKMTLGMKKLFPVRTKKSYGDVKVQFRVFSNLRSRWKWNCVSCGTDVSIYFDRRILLTSPTKTFQILRQDKSFNSY